MPISAGAASSLHPATMIATVPGFDLPDPWLVDTGSRYLMFISSNFEDHTVNVPLLAGKPGHWQLAADALPQLPSWARPVSKGGHTWAPEVFHVGDRWVMYSAPELNDRRYFAALQVVTPKITHCILVSVSKVPEGPYFPAGSDPIVCQTALGGDIDAQLFVDPSGPDGPAHPNYLVWKSDNNNLWKSSTERQGGPTTIWAAPLSDDGLRLTGAPVPIFTPDAKWQQPIVEAPMMVRAPDGNDWLFFSAGRGYYLDQYGMGAVRCLGPLGGCVDVMGHSLISSNAQGSGPGEETLYLTKGHDVWLLYSPWHTGLPAINRPVAAARIGWSTLGPYVVDPPPFPGPG